MLIILDRDGTMTVQDLSFASPQKNVAYDEELLFLAEKGKGAEVLRFWESDRVCIVLGRTSRKEEDLNLTCVRQDNICVVRRSSGGGTVLQGRGCLNYTLILSKHRPQMADLRQSYRFILGKVVQALDHLGVKTAVYPISDIALVKGKKKISGNAQKRGRRFILHHGTILYDFDLTLVSRYLRMPKDIPAYRANRAHKDFLANVPVSVTQIKRELKQVFLC